MRLKKWTFLFLLISNLSFSQLTIEEVGNLPESVSNNAVCEGVINGVPYIYSFGGIDSTKLYSGIHLKSFRYNTSTGLAESIADLPDTLGKIASAANRVGDTIYITGGYHVFSNSNEVSSSKIHRFNIVTNSFMTDGLDIPLSTDDHVQAVWRDSLIYLITGWHNTGNIPNVQIYNPYTNSWLVGSPVPNNNIYKSFGASGTIVNDTIYYFGGASSGNFGAQNFIRKGVIDQNDPTQIDWSYSVPNTGVRGYRSACTNVFNTIHWIGGSKVTYNFDGIAYNGSGGVSIANRDLYFDINHVNWSEDNTSEIPMDLRGIGNVNDSVKYIMGGMIDNQMVTNKIYKLTWDLTFLNLEKSLDKPIISVYPNPVNDLIYITINKLSKSSIDIFNIDGQLIDTFNMNYEKIIELSHYKSGVYFVVVRNEGQVLTKKITKI